ncbi:PucR family transcriptional regulator [Kutzneria sp. NPDC052558]|uniref:PucR family transcriptional regulator n=1 Tax=Kutzneria sp. NPDC052558 TaxID=3364121 RepID=UPI0037C8FDB7
MDHEAMALMSLRRILAIPEWAAAVRLVGGGTAVDHAVTRIRASEGLTPVPPPAADDLLVVTGRTDAWDWRVDVLLRRAADAGAAGVVLPVVQPEPETCRLADRLGIALLSVVGDPLELVVAARVSLTAPLLAGAERVTAAHRVFAGALVEPGDAVARLSRVIGLPVSRLDDSGRVLNGPEPAAGGLRFDLALPQRIPHERGLMLGQPVVPPGAGCPAQWLVVDVPRTQETEADGVVPAMEIGADAVGRWLGWQRLERERHARLRTTLFGDLLRIAGEPGAELRRRVAAAGWWLSGWHVGLCVGADAEIDPVTHRLEVVEALAAEGVEAVVVEQCDGWTAWTTFAQEPSAHQVRDLAGRLRAAQRALGKTIGAHMGVGRPHPQLTGLATTIGEAADAARLAATRPGTDRFLPVDRLGMAQVLLEWSRTDTFEPLARCLLAPLRDLPGDLIRTLAAYLDSESSLAEAATVLGVHRNTVAARVARIATSLGVDLAQRDERLALHLACRTVAETVT